MPRSNSSVPRHRRHRKIVKLAKGYFGARSRNFKAAKAGERSFQVTVRSPRSIAGRKVANKISRKTELLVSEI